MLILKIKYHIVAILKKCIYKIFFGRRFVVGKGTTFRDCFNIYLGKGATMSIGRDCFFNHNCSINSLGSIKIGDGCIFGENVKIYDHNHRFSDVNKKIKEQGYTIKEIEIGRHCWFGSNVVVLKGTHIGNNCVIGAGVVVDQDVPDNTIVKLNRELIFQAIKEKS